MHFFDEIVDFPEKETVFSGSCPVGALWETHERKKEDSKCSNRRVEKKPRREEQQRFFIKAKCISVRKLHARV